MSQSSDMVTTKRSWQRDWPLYIALIVFAIITYIPFVFTIINSFKSNDQFFTEFWLPTFPLHFENYTRAWPAMWRSIMNSFTYSIPTMVLTLIISGLSGYAFARYKFPGRNVLFFMILSLMMIPGILLVVPMFSVVVDIGWGNTIQGVILPWTAGQIVFGTFMMRTFFETLPSEYFEAARLDGASEFTLLFRIAMPLAIPAFATLAILNLLFSWNDLIWPLISIFDSEKFPVSIGVLTFSSQYGTDYGVTFASYVIASLPLIIIFAFTSRKFMDGLSGGLSI